MVIARAAGDSHLTGELLYVRAWIRLRQGQRGAALPLIESGLGLARGLGEAHLAASLLTARAHATYAVGDYAARPAMRPRLWRCSARPVTGNTWGICSATSATMNCRPASWMPHAATWPKRWTSSACSTTATASPTSRSTSAWPSTSAARGTPAQVLAALGRENAAGGPALAPGPHEATSSHEATSVLTPRELDVLKLVVQGLSNPDIAQRLVLSEHTVHRHLANILRKLNLSSRAAAAAWGVRTGLV